MAEDDLTVHILRELREELRATREEGRETARRLDQHIESTNERFDRVDFRFGELREHVDQRILESEVRLATRIVEQTAATRDLYDLLNGSLQLRDRVERCEHDIAELKERT
jgi:predicted nuclease with TOPRIM domain